MQKRHIWAKLAQEIDTDEIVVLTGPRQVGKTTSIHWLMDQIPSTNKLYFDLENLADRSLFETSNYDDIVAELGRRGMNVTDRLYIALDEIQLLPNLPSVVKYLYDHYRIKFFLTGSSSYYIKHRFSESMAGRKLLFELLPLSFTEFLAFRGVTYQLSEKLDLEMPFSEAAFEQLKTFYDEYVEYGGLPKVVLTPDSVRKKRLLEEIFSSYINLDVQVLSDIKSTQDLRRLIQLVAVRIGSRCNTSELANVTGLTRVTVDSYLEFLEQSYIIRSISSYSSSPDVRVRLPKKIYFIDTGIANINADLSSGSQFENTVCHQLSRYGQVSYFGDRTGEIDFVLRLYDQLDQETRVGLEVKETPTAADATRVSRRAQGLDLTQTRLIGKDRSVKFQDYLWAGLIG